MGEVYKFKDHVENRRGYDPKKPLRKKGGKVVAFDLSALAKKTRQGKGEIEGMEYNYGYLPHKVTTKWVAKMERADVGGNIMLMAEGACEILDNWDVVHQAKEVVMEDDPNNKGEKRPVMVPKTNIYGDTIFKRDDKGRVTEDPETTERKKPKFDAEGNPVLEPCPIDPEVVAEEVPITLLNGIFQKVMADMQDSASDGPKDNA